MYMPIDIIKGICDRYLQTLKAAISAKEEYKVYADLIAEKEDIDTQLAEKANERAAAVLAGNSTEVVTINNAVFDLIVRRTSIDELLAPIDPLGFLSGEEIADIRTAFGEEVAYTQTKEVEKVKRALSCALAALDNIKDITDAVHAFEAETRNMIRPAIGVECTCSNLLSLHDKIEKTIESLEGY